VSTFATSSVTVTFTADGSNMSEKREARAQVQDIPGADAFYVDLAGRGPLTLTVGMVLANSTAWGQANVAVGQQGTLAIDGLDTHQAVLMSVNRPAPMPDGQTKATADFLITDA